MKAIIKKSIGNTFLVEVDDSFFDIVFWKKASQLISCAPVISDIINLCPTEVEVNERKPLSDEKLKELLSRNIQWTDKLRNLGDVLGLGIEQSIIYVQDFDYNIKTTKFSERENPKITYCLKIDRFELIVHKSVFIHFQSNPIVRQKRAA